MENSGIVLDRDDLRRALVRIAHEIVEGNAGGHPVALVGIHTRGALMARRLRALIEVPYRERGEPHLVRWKEWRERNREPGEPVPQAP